MLQAIAEMSCMRAIRPIFLFLKVMIFFSGLDSSPIGAEVKKLWKEATSAENSPSSVRSGHSQRSKMSNYSKSNQSPRSVQSTKSSNPQSPRYESPRMRDSPRLNTIQPGYLSDMCRQELTDIEIKSDQQFTKSAETKVTRPHSPVAEFLDHLPDEEPRPHSPVAEILDSLDKIPSSDALETLTKQEETLSDLLSPRSQLQRSIHDFEPVPVDDVDDEDIQEVPEIYRQDRLEKSTLSPQELMVESLWRGILYYYQYQYMFPFKYCKHTYFRFVKFYAYFVVDCFAQCVTVHIQET